MRFLFFLLLVVNVAFGAHVWLTESRGPGEDPRKREINAGQLKIIAVADPKVAASTAARVSTAKQLVESIAGGACVELAGVKTADAAKVQQSLIAANLGDKLAERRVEEPSRWWVYIAPAGNRSTAEATMTSLRRQGIRDVSLQPDNAVSLGLFSSDDAATRYLAEVRGKGAKSAQKAPRSMQVKEHIFTVRDPDTNLVARLTLLYSELEGASLKAVRCLDATLVGATQDAATQTAAPPPAKP